MQFGEIPTFRRDTSPACVWFLRSCRWRRWFPEMLGSLTTDITTQKPLFVFTSQQVGCGVWGVRVCVVFSAHIPCLWDAILDAHTDPGKRLDHFLHGGLVREGKHDGRCNRNTFRRQ
jgi:hypothetical protein